jgi:hypothetical protein
VVVDSVIKGIGHLSCDSKLLSGFPWPVIFKPKKKIKIFTEYENVTQKVLFGDPVLNELNI